MNRHEDEVVRVVRTRDALESLLARLESGSAARPDWIHLQAAAGLDRQPRADWPDLLRQLHRNVLRGFRTADTPNGDAVERLDRWRTIASNGFHDFGEHGWAKAYDSPFVENHDYVAAYLEGGLEALDPYQIYSAVLGSHDYGVEDFVATKACRGVRTIIEPMAGTAEFAYSGHFRFPEFRYLMIDLDEDARRRVLARPWLADTEHHYFSADVLDEEVWKQVKSLSSGPSLAFIGKQSHHLFDVQQLCRLLELGTLYCDSLVLETPAMTLVTELASEEELTRPEMAAAGFDVGLVDLPNVEPNPFTNRIAFRLEAWDEDDHRTLFEYERWTVWTQPTLVALAQLLGLNSYYYHSELDEFVPVEVDAGDSDHLDNVTFMLFSRDLHEDTPR